MQSKSINSHRTSPQLSHHEDATLSYNISLNNIFIFLLRHARRYCHIFAVQAVPHPQMSVINHESDPGFSKSVVSRNKSPNDEIIHHLAANTAILSLKQYRADLGQKSR
jgi:hypothetical protein